MFVFNDLASSLRRTHVSLSFIFPSGFTKIRFGGNLRSCGFHAWLTRAPSARALAWERLKLAALAAHHRTRQTCGAQRLQRELAADGFCVSLGTVRRVRRELGLRCVQQKNRFWVQTTDSGHRLPVAPNLLGQEFKAD